MTMLQNMSDAQARAILLQGLGIKQGGAEFGFKHDSPTGTPTNIYAHGPGGLFTLPGVDPDVFSAVLSTRGMIGMLPASPSIFTDPLFSAVTGVLGDTGSEKVNVCDDPPVAGLMKAGTLKAAFGRYERMTREFEINRLGQYINQSDPSYLRLVNSPTPMGGIADLPWGQEMRGTLLDEYSKIFFELAVSFARLLSKQLWTGNPANNTAGGGYKEFPGFEIQVSADKVDAETNQALPALYSDIKEFGYANVDGSNGGDIVETLTYLMRYLRNNADRMNLDPVNWVIAMRPEAFYEITAVWPCSYLTYRCTFRSGDDSSRLNVNATDQVAMRDALRNGRYLLIDGMQVPVVLDDGIPEDTNTTNGSVPNPCFASDIYVIPLTAMGRQVTYMEYFNLSNEAIMQAMQEGGYASSYSVSGNGLYMLHRKPPVNWCIQWLAKIEPRLIMRTPFLAGRINNVSYCPFEPVRQPYPTDPYWVNGGRTNRNDFPPSFYSEWSPD